jgi:hypothetical protein
MELNSKKPDFRTEKDYFMAKEGLIERVTRSPNQVILDLLVESSKTQISVLKLRGELYLTQIAFCLVAFILFYIHIKT